jgi:hypothetical protein
MKRIFTNLTLAIAFLLCTVSMVASAQTPAPFPGPSDATTAPPTSYPATGVNRVQCITDQIKLNPTNPTSVPTGTTYQWYKIQKDPSTGVETSVLVSTDPAFSETPTSAGYYKYKLVFGNASGCSSDASPVYTYYILPAINPQVVASTLNICSNNQTSSDLTLSPALTTGFTYTYQWTKNGQPISGATLDHYIVSETTQGTYQYAVKVAYSAFSAIGCASPSNIINITVAPPIATPTITFGN